MPKLQEISLLQMDGILSIKETEDAIEMAIKGCNTIYELQREALKKKYGMGKVDSEIHDNTENETENDSGEEVE